MSGGGGGGSPGGSSYDLAKREIKKLIEDYNRLVRDTSKIIHEHASMRLEIQIKDERIKELEKEVALLRKADSAIFKHL